MKQGFAMAFTGGVLDRDAALRSDKAELARLLAEGGRVLPVWRGKPLVMDRPADLASDSGPELSGLGWVGAGSPVLAHGGPPLFLGRIEGVAHFACDISDWSPEAGAEAVQAGFFDPSRQTHPALPEDHGFVELRGVMLALSVQEAELAATAKALLHWHRSHRHCAVCGAVSEPLNGGWQRGCAACGAQHFPRTDPVVIMLVTRGNAVLMGRSPGWPEGMYSCLAGFVEPGETLEAAVRREVMEETGIPVGTVRYVACQPWPFPASLMVGFQAEAGEGEICLDPQELEDALWVSREEMVAAMAGTHPRIKPARKGAIAHALIANWLADWQD